MRILRVNTSCSRGGAADKASSLHEVLGRMDEVEDLVAYGRGTSPNDPTSVRFTLPFEVYTHALVTRLTGLQGYGTPISTKRLRKIIRNFNPDILHAHNLHGYYVDLGSAAAATGNLGIPIVWTFHDAWPLTGRCAFFFDCTHWRQGCGSCPDLRRYPRAFLDTTRFMWRRKRKLFGEHWDPVIVTPSQWLADHVAEACGSVCRIEVIPNGIDVEQFSPQNQERARSELGLPQDKKVVLFAAADLADERKGARHFFDGLRHVEAENWIVATVGKTMQEQAFIPKNVTLMQLGYLGGRDAMATAYNAADLYCIASLDDNLPTTVLESLACGTPVVGFSVGGIPEQVPSDCGQLVSPKDSRALGRAMSTLLEDDTLRELMGRSCRRRAEEEYDLHRFVERYLALYHELVGGD